MKNIELTYHQKISSSINTFAFLSILSSIVFLIIKIWSESKFMTITMIPDYSVIYMNGAEINLIAFLIGSMIPALYLRYKGHYLISTICISVFYVVGFALKNSIDLYENCYALL